MIAEASVVITNQAQTFHWAGYGLKLHVPQGALPASLDECRFLIKVGISGHFALPQNTSLVSAVYWLDSEPRCKFSQPLTLEIQHCAMSSQTSRLSFALARCSQKNLPYTFEILDGGEFSSLSTYGCIQLQHFSLVTLVKRWIMGEDSVRYCARLYYLRKGVNLREIHFVITKDQEAHVTVCYWVLFLVDCYCSQLLVSNYINRLFNRSILPKVPQLGQMYQLSLNQRPFHCNCLLKRRCSKEDGKFFHCFLQW